MAKLFLDDLLLWQIPKQLKRKKRPTGVTRTSPFSTHTFTPKRLQLPREGNGNPLLYSIPDSFQSALKQITSDEALTALGVASGSCHLSHFAESKAPCSRSPAHRCRPWRAWAKARPGFSSQHFPTTGWARTGLAGPQTM